MTLRNNSADKISTTNYQNCTALPESPEAFPLIATMNYDQEFDTASRAHLSKKYISIGKNFLGSIVKKKMKNKLFDEFMNLGSSQECENKIIKITKYIKSGTYGSVSEVEFNPNGLVRNKNKKKMVVRISETKNHDTERDIIDSYITNIYSNMKGWERCPDYTTEILAFAIGKNTRGNFQAVTFFEKYDGDCSRLPMKMIKKLLPKFFNIFEALRKNLIVHGDAKLDNFLYKNESNGETKIVITDYDFAVFYHRKKDGSIVRDNFYDEFCITGRPHVFTPCIDEGFFFVSLCLRNKYMIAGKVVELASDKHILLTQKLLYGKRTGVPVPVVDGIRQNIRFYMKWFQNYDDTIIKNLLINYQKIFNITY